MGFMVLKLVMEGETEIHHIFPAISGLIRCVEASF